MRPGDRKELEGWVRARTTPQRRVERARIVLGSAGGLSGRALARQIGVSLPTVQRWLDRPWGVRSGRSAYSDEVVHPFRAKLSTCSGPRCPLVPSQAVRMGAGILKGCWTWMDQAWS